MAIHSGEAAADYRGPDVNRAARIRSIGHGEQILISGVTAGIVGSKLPDGATLLDLGQHRLRDLAQTEHLFQLAHPDLREEFPPLKSLGNFRQKPPSPTDLVHWTRKRKENSSGPDQSIIASRR